MLSIFCLFIFRQPLGFLQYLTGGGGKGQMLSRLITSRSEFLKPKLCQRNSTGENRSTVGIGVTIGDPDGLKTPLL